jgi:hypothetical protein
MTRLHAYIDELNKRLDALPADERQAVMDEVQSHLDEDVAARVSAGAKLADAEHASTEAFGTPAEIAAGYDTSEQVLHTACGATISIGSKIGNGARAAGRGAVVVGRTAGKGVAVVGRGAGKMLKYGIISALAILGIGAFIAVATLLVFDDEIKEAVPRPIDFYDRTCTTTSPCAGPERASSFDIGSDVKEFRIAITGSCDAGRARVTATDSSGDLITLAENACSNGGMKTFTEQGRWTIDVVYTGYVGDVQIDVYAFERA